MTLSLGDTAPDFEADTTTGRIKFHSDNELLKRGIINTPRGLKQMVHFSNPGNPFVYDGYATFTQEDWDKL